MNAAPTEACIAEGEKLPVYIPDSSAVSTEGYMPYLKPAFTLHLSLILP